MGDLKICDYFCAFVGLIKFMNAPQKHSIHLPIGDDVIVKITETATFNLNNVFIFNSAQFLYSSTQEIADKFVKIVTNSNAKSEDFLEKEIKAGVLEPGKKWVAGTIRLRLVVEFSPDEPEKNGTSDKSVSTLDDIRNIKL